VYSFGYLAMPNKGNSGFLAQLYSPDTSRIKLQLKVVDNSFCNKVIKATPYGGVGPFEYSWNDNNYSSDNLFKGGCTNDTVQCIVRDARGCFDTLNYVIPPNASSAGNIFPNPTSDLVSIQFMIDQPQAVYIEIYNTSGRLVKKLETLAAKKGLNEYIFSMTPLANGIYSILLISNENNEVLQKDKIVKQ